MNGYVSKDQVIEWFRPYGHLNEGIPYYELVTDIRDMPDADVVPSTKWTVVSEGLPPEGKLVLCWYAYFRSRAYRLIQTFIIGYQYGGRWIGEKTDRREGVIIAWMPLPEPPVKG